MQCIVQLYTLWLLPSWNYTSPVHYTRRLHYVDFWWYRQICRKSAACCFTKSGGSQWWCQWIRKGFCCFFLLKHLVNCEERSGGLICGGSLVLSFFCDRIVIQQMVFARFVVVFSTLGKLWRERRRGGWYVEGPLWLTSQGTATSVSTPQLLLLNKIQRQFFFINYWWVTTNTMHQK